MTNSSSMAEGSVFPVPVQRSSGSCL
jgi:hypothetical protein